VGVDIVPKPTRFSLLHQSYPLSAGLQYHLGSQIHFVLFPFAKIPSRFEGSEMSGVITLVMINAAGTTSTGCTTVDMQPRWLRCRGKISTANGTKQILERRDVVVL
jgi:hypothetical protein